MTIDPSILANIEAVMAAKRAERDAAIDDLMAERKARGSTVDRAFWAMVHDFEYAPFTTNRLQLEEIGLRIPMEIPSSDAEVSTLLSIIINGLAVLRTYLLNTNHLTDRELLVQLNRDVLDEEIWDTCFAPDVQEWVDLSMLGLPEETFNALYGPDGPKEGVTFPSDRDSSLPRPDDKPPHHQP